MTVQYHVDIRNAMLEAIETVIGTSPKFQHWTGSMPANLADASTGTQLTEFALGSDWSTAAASGTKAYASTPISTTALAAGTCGYYRVLNTAESVCYEQGTVTATGGGGDMTIDNPVLASGQTVQITAFTKTAPGA